MWVFKNDAFVSIVEDKDLPDQLWVRARVRGDIERFFAGDLIDPIIIETNNADYRFRLACSRFTVRLALEAAEEDIDYVNFKSSIAKTDTGDRRHTAYLRVWTAMINWQREEKGMEEQAALRKKAKPKKKKGPQA